MEKFHGLVELGEIKLRISRRASLIIRYRDWLEFLKLVTGLSFFFLIIRFVSSNQKNKVCSSF